MSILLSKQATHCRRTESQNHGRTQANASFQTLNKQSQTQTHDKDPINVPKPLNASCDGQYPDRCHHGHAEAYVHYDQFVLPARVSEIVS